MPKRDEANRFHHYLSLEDSRLLEHEIQIDHSYQMLTRYSQPGKIHVLAHEVMLAGIDRVPDHPSILSLILMHTDPSQMLQLRPNIQEGYLSVFGPQLHVGRQWATQGFLIEPPR